MSDSPDSLSPRDCYWARVGSPGTQTNVDVDGIAVSVANVVVHVCLRILITWSPGDIDEGIQAILLQIYPILLSTLLSIGRKQLSLFDASFALILTSSPLTVYLVVASICDWFGIETGLYKRIKSHRLIVRSLGTLVLFLWFGLSVTLRLSDRAFIDSRVCQGSTFRDWLVDFFQYVVGVATDPGIPIVPLNYIIVFAPASLILIWEWYKAYRSGLLARPRKWVCLPWIVMRWAWRNLTNHKWYMYLLFAFLDLSWVVNVVDGAVAASKGNVPSYGQVLSLFTVVPPVISASRLVHSRLRDFLARYSRRNPTSSSPGSTSQEVSCEALPEESQQPEGPTLNSPRPPAHPGFKRGRSLPNLPTSLVEDIPLADIILANRGDPTTTETTEPICDVHGSSPPVTEPVMQVLTEDVPSICEQQRDVVANGPANHLRRQMLPP